MDRLKMRGMGRRSRVQSLTEVFIVIVEMCARVLYDRDVSRVCCNKYTQY